MSNFQSAESLYAGYALWGSLVTLAVVACAALVLYRRDPTGGGGSGTGSWLEPDGTDALDGSRATKWS